MYDNVLLCLTTIIDIKTCCEKSYLYRIIDYANVCPKNIQ